MSVSIPATKYLRSGGEAILPDNYEFNMAMELEFLLNKLETDPTSVEFPDVVALINSMYTFIPTGFRNHELYNEPGQNSGSCKLLSFARLHDLNEAQTLACFGAYYRADVLKNPEGDSHPNIRQFQKTGWEGIEFDGIPLRATG